MITPTLRCIGLAWAVVLVSCGTSKKSQQMQGGDIVLGSSTASEPASDKVKSSPDTIEEVKNSALKLKYAHYLNTTPDQIQNLKLYYFLDQWLNTPYKWGGTDDKGIDCSAFMQRLLADVYNIQIPRTSVDQFFASWVDRFASTHYLSEGDLVFFRTMDEKIISHVGLYLTNRMFVNASSSKGVSIACLDDAYWKKCYVAAGRVRTAAAENK